MESLTGERRGREDRVGREDRGQILVKRSELVRRKAGVKSTFTTYWLSLLPKSLHLSEPDFPICEMGIVYLINIHIESPSRCLGTSVNTRV